MNSFGTLAHLTVEKESSKSPKNLLFLLLLLLPHLLCVFFWALKKKKKSSGEKLEATLLMSMPLEHDYIGLSESIPVPSMETNSKINNNKNKNGLNLKATELRLGLPGSESPERDDDTDDVAGGLKISLVSAGAKRVFSDAIDGASGNWVFSSGSSDSSANLFSPKSVNNAGSDQCKNQTTSAKDGVSVPPQSPKPLHDKISKPQASAPASK